MREHLLTLVTGGCVGGVWCCGRVGAVRLPLWFIGKLWKAVAQKTEALPANSG